MCHQTTCHFIGYVEEGGGNWFFGIIRRGDCRKASIKHPHVLQELELSPRRLLHLSRRRVMRGPSSM